MKNDSCLIEKYKCIKTIRDVGDVFKHWYWLSASLSVKVTYDVHVPNINDGAHASNRHKITLWGFTGVEIEPFQSHGVGG